MIPGWSTSADPGQQMGDGGFSAQFHDAESGEADCRIRRNLALHVNSSCSAEQELRAFGQYPLQDCRNEITPEPEGWMSAEFDDSDWPAAVVHTAAAVRPIRGYHES